MGDIETVTIVRASGAKSIIRAADYDPAVHKLLADIGKVPAPPALEVKPQVPPARRGSPSKGKGR